MDVNDEKLKSLLDRKFEKFTTDCFGPLKHYLDEIRLS